MRQRKHERLTALTSATVALTLSFTLAGCGSAQDSRVARSRALVTDGSAERLLQAYFNHHPQCSLLPIGPIFDFAGGNDRPMVKALVAAGILTARPLNDALHTIRYEPTPAAQRWIPPEQAPLVAPRRLCFGYRRITHVFLDEAESGGNIRYSFDLVRPAPWVNDPAIQAAAPNLAAAFGEFDFTGADPVSIKDGKLDDSLILPTESYPLFDRLGVNVSGVTRQPKP